MSKLPNIGTSIFATMSQLAEQYKAINLSQGFPDFQVSRRLVSMVNDAMKKGYNQYAPMPGLLSLRERIAEKTSQMYMAEYNPETEITVTSGATEALYSAISALVDEGDEVIIFEPAYDSYAPVIRLNGGTPIYVGLKHPDYKVDWHEVTHSITARTKMIIINTPHNPTGTVLSEEDMLQLVKLVNGSKIILLSDEVYEHIVFDNTEHQSVTRFTALRDRSIVVSSFGKTFHATGWKLGYILAPENLTKEIRKVHQFVVYAVNTPVQYALSEYLDKNDEYKDLGNFYAEKRDYLLDGISNTNFIAKPSKGTYFQLIDYSQITSMPDIEFADLLVKEFGLATIPVSVFNHDKVQDKVLRLCFAKENKTMDAAFEKLKKISSFDFSTYQKEKIK